jgi:uncharacterized protein (TIGR03437 family)
VHPGGAQAIEPVASYQTPENRYVPTAIDFGPADDQMVLSLFGTGLRLRSTTNGVEVRIAGEIQQVLFAGAQGTFAGLDQINISLSRTLMGRGDVDVLVTVDGVQTNQLSVRFK